MSIVLHSPPHHAESVGVLCGPCPGIVALGRPLVAPRVDLRAAPSAEDPLLFRIPKDGGGGGGGEGGGGGRGAAAGAVVASRPVFEHEINVGWEEQGVAVGVVGGGPAEADEGAGAEGRAGDGEDVGSLGAAEVRSQKSKRTASKSSGGIDEKHEKHVPMRVEKILLSKPPVRKAAAGSSSKASSPFGGRTQARGL